MGLKLINYDALKNLKFVEFCSWAVGGGGKGVYRFFNGEKEIIYIGKSVNLSSRINDHLEGSSNTDFFIHEVDYIDHIYVDDELDRTVLEAVLIKYYKPKYNQEVRGKKRKVLQK
jgi:excinuclease UvrABC nuclease subunit